MHLISEDDFWRRVTALGIELDSRYPGAEALAFEAHTQFARFWVLDLYSYNWPALIAGLLETIDSWTEGLLWPRGGGWLITRQDAPPDVRTLDATLRAFGISNGVRGAALFQRQEQDLLSAVMFIQTVFAEQLHDDLYFIPDHGRQFIHTDHHGVIHLQCSTAKSIDFAVQKLQELGFSLPTELPDETFKRPSWMKAAAEASETREPAK
jgi:hypothetical protein